MTPPPVAVEYVVQVGIATQPLLGKTVRAQLPAAR
jgi:hypothetical protein